MRVQISLRPLRESKASPSHELVRGVLLLPAGSQGITDWSQHEAWRRKSMETEGSATAQFQWLPATHWWLLPSQDPHGVCRSFYLPKLSCPSSHCVVLQAAKWLPLDVGTSLIHLHGWIKTKNSPLWPERPPQCKPVSASPFMWVWRCLCFSHEPVPQLRNS